MFFERNYIILKINIGNIILRGLLFTFLSFRIRKTGSLKVGQLFV